MDVYRNSEELEGNILLVDDIIILNNKKYNVLLGDEVNYLLNRRGHSMFINENLKIINIKSFIIKHMGYYIEGKNGLVIKTNTLEEMTKISIELFKLNEKVNV